MAMVATTMVAPLTMDRLVWIRRNNDINDNSSDDD